MKYVIEKNGSLIIGPTVWNNKLSKLCGLSNNKEAPSTPYSVGEVGTLRSVKVVKATPTKFQFVIEDSGELIDGVWTITQSLKNYSEERIKENLLKEVAPKRYEKEVAGIQVDVYKVDTDRESQLKMIGLMLEAQTDPTFTVKWKMHNGSWATLDATQAIYIAKACSKHVKDCYAREESLQKEISEANSFEELTQIDLESGWPSILTEEVI